MTVGEVSGWRFSRFSRNHCQAGTGVLSQVNIKEPFQLTESNVKTHSSFSLYGAGLAETPRSWIPTSSCGVRAMMTGIFSGM